MNTGNRDGTLYRTYDEDFAEEFSLSDAEVLGPVLRTPWCGDSFGTDFRELTSNGWGGDSSVQETIRVRGVFNREYGAGRRDDQSYFRILEAEMGEYEVYIFDFPAVRTGESRTWFQDIVASYKCAMRLGAFVQTPVFGDGWIAMQRFEGEKLLSRELVENLRAEGVLTDQYRQVVTWDLARLTLIGHSEVGVSSMVVSPTGEFRHGTLEAAGHPISPYFFRYMIGVRRALSRLGRTDLLYAQFEEYLRTLAETVDNQGTLEEYSNRVILENIQTAQEIVPVVSDRPVAELISDPPGDEGIPSAGQVRQVLASSDNRSEDFKRESVRDL